MPEIKRRATFKGSRQRLTLEREWSDTGPIAMVIGCNPSTADHTKDDPTSRWWNAWFYRHGFRGYIAMNLYPFCTSSPAECRRIVSDAWNGLDWGLRDDMVGNMYELSDRAKRADQIFACWGAIAWDLDWVDRVVDEIHEGVAPYPAIWCWGKTASGAPKHPLARGKHRIPPDQQPILWRKASS